MKERKIARERDKDRGKNEIQRERDETLRLGQKLEGGRQRVEA